MPDVIELVKTTVKTTIKEHHLLPADGKLIVAVSGGADSLCLLHLLHSLCGPSRLYPGVQLHVAHLNHRLRGEESEREAVAVAQLAASWGLPVSVGSIDVAELAQREQRSLEEAARTARYRFLREIAQGGRIAVAHHADDQAETLLLHWLRGGGISSMIGLQPLQQDIIRPLLSITHADTLAYCAAHSLVPVEDASNADTRFLRNRIRHELLPLLEEINPGFRATLLRTAEIMQVDAEWIEAQVDANWSAVVISEQSGHIHLQRGPFCALPLSIQRHLLRRVTARLCDGQSPLELRHYKLIEQLARRKSKGRELERHLPGHLRMLRSGEDLFFERVDEFHIDVEGEQSEAILPLPGRVIVPGTTWLAVAETITGEQAQAIKADLLTHMITDATPAHTTTDATPTRTTTDAIPAHTTTNLPPRSDKGRRGGDEGALCLSPSLPPQPYNSPGTSLATTPNVVYIDGDRVGATLTVRTRRAGDRIQPLGMAHEKKVQDILVDRHITRSQREQIPLFFSEQHCVWLGGICIDERVRLTAATQRIVCLSLVPLE
jgi:tRNA(Ile)-lysidine synthase